MSTDQEEQLNSFENQVDYYTKYINEKPDYQMVDIYSDEGISGTNTKKREGFNRMITDCEAGKIDLVITKSISRFARNVVDLLETVRHLKAMGIDVWFEKENIRSLSADGELMLGKGEYQHNGCKRGAAFHNPQLPGPGRVQKYFRKL